MSENAAVEVGARSRRRIRVPGSTSNLGSGFDVLGLALQMYLDVEVDLGGNTPVIEAAGLGAERLPRDSSNLIYALLCEHAGAALPRGLRLRIQNGIPLMRGFGSSAAATVAGIALGQWLRDGAPPDRDAVLAAACEFEGHPDNVSASVFGGLTVSAVVNGKVLSTSLRLPDGVGLVAIIPEAEISTRQARELLADAIPRTEVVFNLQRLGVLLCGLATNRKELLNHGVRDQIHQNRRIPLLPAMGNVLSELNAHESCLGAFVSGAGPAVASFCGDHPERLGEIGVAEFQKHGIPSEFRVVAPDYSGMTVHA